MYFGGGHVRHHPARLAGAENGSESLISGRRGADKA
uniref:Uncharacterized protein n=1 Tax=mine drainage metagenome TaxID=410659 RepID=E6QLE7_9ZZZZ